MLLTARNHSQQLRQEARKLKPKQVAETTSLTLDSPFRRDIQQRKPRTHKSRSLMRILLPAVRQALAGAKAARKKNRRVGKKKSRDQWHLKLRGGMRRAPSPSLPRGRKKMKVPRPPVSFAVVRFCN